MVRFGILVRSLREAAGHNQGDFAKKCGMSRPTLSKIEAHADTPDDVARKHRFAIAGALSMSDDELMSRWTPPMNTAGPDRSDAQSLCHKLASDTDAVVVIGIKGSGPVWMYTKGAPPIVLGMVHQVAKAVADRTPVVSVA